MNTMSFSGNSLVFSPETADVCLLLRQCRGFACFNGGFGGVALCSHAGTMVSCGSGGGACCPRIAGLAVLSLAPVW